MAPDVRRVQIPEMRLDAVSDLTLAKEVDVVSDLTLAMVFETVPDMTLVVRDPVLRPEPGLRPPVQN